MDDDDSFLDHPNNFSESKEVRNNTCDVPNIYQVYNVGAVYYLISTLGILFNLFVLLVFILHKKACNVSQIYLCNLAMADFLQMFFQFFWAVYISNELIWPFGNHMCKLVSLSTIMNYNCVMFFLALVSIDRYLALVHPFFECKMRKERYAKIICLLVWIFGFLLGIPTLVCKQVKEQIVIKPYNETFEIETVKHLCSFNCSQNVKIANQVFQNIFPFDIPMVILIFCTIKIVQVLKRQQSKRTSTQKMELKVTILVLVVLVTFLVLRLPFNLARAVEEIFRLCADIKSQCSVLKNILICRFIFKYFASFHSVLNPVLYVMVGKNFRQKMWEVFSRFVSINQS